MSTPPTITKVDIDVGRRIAQRRRSIRLSQVALAEKLGISFQQVQKYERGANRVGAGRLSQIADILGVPVTYFFQDLAAVAENKTTISQNIGTSIVLQDDNEIALINAYRKIKDPTVKKLLIQMANQIAESHPAG